jgi:iron complex outermembrane receptor protein
VSCHTIASNPHAKNKTAFHAGLGVILASFFVARPSAVRVLNRYLCYWKDMNIFINWRRFQSRLAALLKFGSLFVWFAQGTSLMAQADANQLEPLKRLSLEQLAQTEITSVSKEPVSAFQTPAAIRILTHDEIINSGARTIADVLRLVPGVEVGQIDSNEWAVGVRGFQGKLSRAVLVLIDGRSVYTPLFAGVYWEMQDVMLEDIDRIEIIRGPAGTIWGSNAVNGVINIITKNARNTHGMLVTVGGGTMQQGFADWRYGAGNDDLSYRVWGKAFNTGAQHHSDGKNFDDWRRGQAGFRIDWKSSDRDAITIQGDGYSAEAGQSVRLNFFSPPSNPVVEGNRRFNGQNIMASWRRVLSPASDFQLLTYYDRTQREELSYKEVRHTFDADFIHHLAWGRQDITWGLGTRISPSTFIQKVPTVDFLPHDDTYNIFSAFLQDDLVLVRDRLNLTIGSKFEHTTYSGFNYQPGARLAWTPNRQHILWGAVTRAVRTASRIEEGFNLSALAAPNPPIFFRLVGDGKFEPEESIGYELGYRKYLTSLGFFSASLFHNRYDDLLSIESRPGELETTPVPHQVIPLDLRNGILAKSTGGELTALWDAREWMRLRVSYAYVHVDAKRKPASNDASTVRQLEGDTPRHKVVIQDSITLPREFQLDLTYRYVSAIPNQLIKGYSTADFSLRRPLGRQFEVQLVGRNLLQPSHAEYGGNPGGLVGIRRSGYVSLTWAPSQ